MSVNIRVATLGDMAQIFQLYAETYGGTYPDLVFSDAIYFEEVIQSLDHNIFVAENHCREIIASVQFSYNENMRLAKVQAAVVTPFYRGKGISQKLIQYGIDFDQQKKSSIEVFYSTLRTVNKAAQNVFKKLGFIEVGIFPNVHKTTDYETHILCVLYLNDSLAKRFLDFGQHPEILPLFNIIRPLGQLAEMQIAEIQNVDHYLGTLPELEVIEAKNFIQSRKQLLYNQNKIEFAFLPFYTPNLLLSSEDQSVEVFLSINEVDNYCLITGCTVKNDCSFTDLLLKVSSLLRARGVHYVEINVKAHKLTLIDKILKANFIPCGYVPAFQKEGKYRYDYISFSRSFETLNLAALDLSKEGDSLIRLYIKRWKKLFLGKYA